MGINKLLIIPILMLSTMCAKVNYYDGSTASGQNNNIDFKNQKTSTQGIDVSKIWKNKNGQQEGKNSGTGIKNYFSNFKQHISEPMLGEVNNTTPDGSTQFKQNISCDQNASVLVEIDYTLGANSSPIFKISAEPNQQGVFTENFTSPYNATSVCAKGIMVCPNNALSSPSCKYYNWKYDKGLSLEEVAKSTVNDCTCINDSCKSNSVALSVSDKSMVLNLVSGAIYATIAPNKQNEMLNKAIEENGKYVMYGQRMGDCDNYKEGETPKVNLGTDEDFSNIVDYEQKVNDIAADSNSSLNAVNNSAIGQRSNQNYQFYSETQQMVNDGLTTSTEVENNTQNNGTSFNVITNKSNSAVSGTVGVNTNELEEADRESYVCIVKIPTDESGKVYTNNTTKDDATNNSITYKYETRSCTNNGSNCPHTYPEKIQKRCGQDDGSFQRNVAILSSIDELSKDVICK